MTTNRNNQKTYRVIATTNGYIASRDLMFDGKVRVTLASGLSLDEAREKLLDLWNERVDDDLLADSVEEAAELSEGRIDRMTVRAAAGLPSFDYDSRIFSITEEGEDEE